MAYVPSERLKALDIDRVDAEVLFPNPPGGSYHAYGDPEFELDVVRAYNDTLSGWVSVSDAPCGSRITAWRRPAAACPPSPAGSTSSTVKSPAEPWPTRMECRGSPRPRVVYPKYLHIRCAQIGLSGTVMVRHQGS